MILSDVCLSVAKTKTDEERTAENCLPVLADSLTLLIEFYLRTSTDV